MVSFNATIRSKHPPHLVFDYLAEFSTAVQWDPGIVEGESLVSRPPALGSRFHLVSEFVGRKVELTYEITEFDQPRRFTVQADGGGFASEDTVTVEPVGDGCDVHYHATLSFSGVGRLLTPIWWHVFRRIGSKAAAGLADWLNRDELGRPPSRTMKEAKE
jgi:hypothetical protein